MGGYTSLFGIERRIEICVVTVAIESCGLPHQGDFALHSLLFVARFYLFCVVPVHCYYKIEK
jgi:hypothetical protein